MNFLFRLSVLMPCPLKVLLNVSYTSATSGSQDSYGGGYFARMTLGWIAALEDCTDAFIGDDVLC